MKERQENRQANEQRDSDRGKLRGRQTNACDWRTCRHMHSCQILRYSRQTRTDSLTHWLTQRLTDSLTHLQYLLIVLTDWLTDSLTESLTDCTDCTDSLTHLLTHWLTVRQRHTCIQSNIHLYIDICSHRQWDMTQDLPMCMYKSLFLKVTLSHIHIKRDNIPTCYTHTLGVFLICLSLSLMYIPVYQISATSPFYLVFHLPFSIGSCGCTLDIETLPPSLSLCLSLST